jgi:hypothetical protein
MSTVRLIYFVRKRYVRCQYLFVSVSTSDTSHSLSVGFMQTGEAASSLHFAEVVCLLFLSATSKTCPFISLFQLIVIKASVSS